VFLRLDSPHFVPLRAPLIQMVFGENGASVRTVMIGGAHRPSRRQNS